MLVHKYKLEWHNTYSAQICLCGEKETRDFQELFCKAANKCNMSHARAERDARHCSFYDSSMSSDDYFFCFPCYFFHPASCGMQHAGPCHAGSGCASSSGLIQTHFSMHLWTHLHGGAGECGVREKVCVMWSNMLHLLSPTSSLLTYHNKSNLGFCYLKMSCPICVVCLGNVYRLKYIKLSIVDLQKWQFLMIPA